jgi:hypothetical protein
MKKKKLGRPRGTDLTGRPVFVRLSPAEHQHCDQQADRMRMMGAATYIRHLVQCAMTHRDT